MPIFYTYMWLRYDGTPYYIGKGTGNRAYYRAERKGVNPPADRDRILIQDWPTEDDAFEAEKFLIVLFGRKDIGTGILHNRSDGGEGPFGFKRPPRSEQHNARQRSAQLGKKLSEEQKKKISIALKGKKKPPFSEEHRRKIGEYRRNNPRVCTQEYSEKMRAAARKRWDSAAKNS